MSIIPVTEVGKTSQSGTEHRFESLAVLSGQGEVELEVLLDLLQRTQTPKIDSSRRLTSSVMDFSVFVCV